MQGIPGLCPGENVKSASVMTNASFSQCLLVDYILQHT